MLTERRLFWCVTAECSVFQDWNCPKSLTLINRINTTWDLLLSLLRDSAVIKTSSPNWKVSYYCSVEVMKCIHLKGEKGSSLFVHCSYHFHSLFQGFVSQGHVVFTLNKALCRLMGLMTHRSFPWRAYTLWEKNKYDLSRLISLLRLLLVIRMLWYSFTVIHNWLRNQNML